MQRRVIMNTIIYSLPALTVTVLLSMRQFIQNFNAYHRYIEAMDFFIERKKSFVAKFEDFYLFIFYICLI